MKSDLKGMRFGRLTVVCKGVDYFTNNGHKFSMFICKCDCGSVKAVRRNSLVSNRTKSCGCLHIESISSHNKSKTRMYKAWGNMKDRCYNHKHPDFKNWGGRGIAVCDSWRLDFDKFYSWAVKNGYNDSLEIDRINNSKGYDENNCRWTTRQINTINQRIQSNNKTGYRGVEFHKISRKYRSRVVCKRKEHYVGYIQQ